MSLLSFLLVALGVALLYLGGEALVRGSVDLARTLGLSPLVIGLTVVAFATSAPELAASLTAALADQPDIALGNVLGSNVANIGLILGVAALLQPLRAQAKFLRREIPFMIGLGLLLFPFFLDRVLGRLEGLILLGLLALYLWVLLRVKEKPLVEAELEELVAAPPRPLWQSAALVGAGVGLLVGGAAALVEGAVDIALALGVPERVVGLTLVAFGTSLPELASSIVAARRREADIVLGNVIGSNVFNVACILGTTALVQPIPVAAEILRVDLWVMLAFSLVVVPLLLPQLVLGRARGLALVVLYVGYVVFLFL